LVQQQIEIETQQQLESESENRKDQRIDKQALAQSKLIAQRQGERPPLDQDIVTNLTL